MHVIVAILVLLVTHLGLKSTDGISMRTGWLKSSDGKLIFRHHSRQFKVNMMMMMSTQTNTINIQATHYTLRLQMQETLYIVKNSKFYAKTVFADSVDDAIIFVNKHKDVKASHNCWAYRGLDYERSSDDGEPSGIAGRPILSALQEYDVKNCVVLVTRFLVV